MWLLERRLSLADQNLLLGQGLLLALQLATMLQSLFAGRDSLLLNCRYLRAATAPHWIGQSSLKHESILLVQAIQELFSIKQLFFEGFLALAEILEQLAEVLVPVVELIGQLLLLFTITDAFLLGNLRLW